MIIIAGTSVGASVILHINLTDKLESAREDGMDEGYADGYEDGLIEGSIAGYQEGSTLGYQTSKRINADNGDMDNLFFIYNPTYREVQEILKKDKLC